MVLSRLNDGQVSQFKIFIVVRVNIGSIKQKAMIDISVVILIHLLVYRLQYTSFDDTCNSYHALTSMKNNPIRPSRQT
jgi:hypothetical protein